MLGPAQTCLGHRGGSSSMWAEEARGQTLRIDAAEAVASTSKCRATVRMGYSDARSQALSQFLQWARGHVASGAGMSIGATFGLTADDRFPQFNLHDFLESNPPGRLFSSEGLSKVLVLYETTGGGHKASAQALRDAFEEKFPGKFQVTTLDVLPLCSPPFNKSDKAYDFMVKHSFLWKAAFGWSSTKWGEKIGVAWYNVGLVDNLRKLFREIQPDLIVSVHPLLQAPVISALKSMRKLFKEPKKVPFATVVTDYTTCHAVWFDNEVDLCFVPTDETRAFALKRGLGPSQIKQWGLPIRPAFSKPFPSKARLRSKLRLDRNLSAVLIVGGGDGMGPVAETCSALSRRMHGKGQVIVVCGRNKKLAAKLRSCAFESKVHVLGFVANMHEWMAASDCIVTKAGPGTIAEALVCGLPIMLNSFIPCQESGNIPWVQDNQVGDFSADPEVVAATVVEWLSDRERLAAMRQKTLQLGRPEATFRIVDDLVDLVRRHRWQPFKGGDLNKDGMESLAAVPA